MPEIKRKRKGRILKVLEYLKNKLPVDFVIETEEGGPQFSFKGMQEAAGKPNKKKVRRFLKKKKMFEKAKESTNIHGVN